MFRTTTLGVAALMLAGCGTTQGPPSGLGPTGSEFRYLAPTTKLTLQTDLVLASCEPTPQVVAPAVRKLPWETKDILVAGSADVAAVGAGDPKVQFRVVGDQLISAMQRRELKIELTDARTLKSVNSASSDRTGAVITNVFKLFTSVAGAFVGLPTGFAGTKTEDRERALLQEEQKRRAASPCNTDTYNALLSAAKLRARIDETRKEIAKSPSVDAGKRLTLLTNELAAVTAASLTISAKRPLAVGDKPVAATEIDWTIADLSKWFAADPKADACAPRDPALFPIVKDEKGVALSRCEVKTKLFAVTYEIIQEADPVPAEREPPPKSKPPAAHTPANSPCKVGAAFNAGCDHVLVFVEPARGKVKVLTASENYAGKTAKDELGGTSAPIAQWGTAQYLTLNVGFAQSRTAAMTFDQFGRKQTFTWNAEASAENATGALVGMADAGVKAIKADDQAELDAMKAEADRLETEMRLKKARACQAINASGGLVCEPTTSPSP